MDRFPGLHRHGDAPAARGWRRVRVRADAARSQWGRELRQGGENYRGWGPGIWM